MKRELRPSKRMAVVYAAKPCKRVHRIIDASKKSPLREFHHDGAPLSVDMIQDIANVGSTACFTAGLDDDRMLHNAHL